MNILQSVITNKCPRCRKGDLFFPFKKFSDTLRMPDKCSHCGQPTSPAPGFYYGAMFMSYIMTAFLYLGIVGTLIIFFDFTVNQAFLALIVFVLITYIPTARFSRSVWIHMMVTYDNSLRS